MGETMGTKTDIEKWDLEFLNKKVERMRKIVRAKTSHAPETGTVFPTVRYVARRLQLRQSEIVELADVDEHIDLLIGVQIQGMGTGEFDNIGDYQLEYLDD